MFCNDAISTIYIQPRTFVIIPTTLYFTSETLCLLRIYLRMPIYFAAYLLSLFIPFFSFLVIPLAFHLDPLWYADKRQDDLDKRIIIRIVEEAHIYLKTAKPLYNNPILYYFSYYKHNKTLPFSKLYKLNTFCLKEK
jgi:hypothetical protein